MGNMYGDYNIMTIKDRINNRIVNYALKRLNVASMLTYESIRGMGGLKYQDRLISGGYHDFWDNYSRKEVMLNDAVADRITLGFLKHVFEKAPKFAENDEVVSNYIMEDVRDAVDTLGLKPKFIMNGTNIVINGWSHNLWQLEKDDEGKINGLGAKIFGFEECHPRYWRRSTRPDSNNKILYYRAIYVPRPAGMNALYHTLNEERFFNNPHDINFQHLTRIDWNYGFGYNRIQPIWDAITKLREQSDSDHFMNSNYMETRYPAAWTKEGKAKLFIDAVRKATRKRGLAVEAVQNIQTGEDTGLPSVQFRPWGQGAQGQPMDTNRASAYLDGEWLRLLVNLGYSQDWATGTSAGQQEGSELNLTRDDRADIAEFTVLADAFKKMLKRLAELGVMQALGTVSQESIDLLLSGKYVMQCWLTWEYNDKAALQQEQLDHEMEMQQGKESGKNAFNTLNDGSRLNQLIEGLVIYALKTNQNFPTTPVSSTWISHVAVRGKDLFMKIPGWEKGPWAGYRFESEQIAGLKGREMLSSDSRGGWVWDNIWAEGVKPFSKGPRPTQPGINDDISGIIFSQDPFGEEARIPETETFEERRKALLEPPAGLIGTEKTRRPLYQTPTETFSAEDITSFTPFEESRDPGLSTATEPSVLTSGRVADPTSITGTKKVGPGAKRKRGISTTRNPIVPYNPTIYNAKFKKILNSNSALMRFAKTISTDHNPTGWGMKSGTTYKIKELVYELANYATRVNRVSYGNSIKAGHKYNYGGEDEEICPRDYKMNIGKTVPLGIYHNQDKKGNIELPEWQVIGTHEVLGWDDELGQEIAKNDYDVDKIDLFFNTRNERNWIWEDYLSKGIEPPISGAYTCNVKKHNGINYQVNINLKSMSFVKDGNCPWDVCNFKVMEVVV